MARTYTMDFSTNDLSQVDNIATSSPWQEAASGWSTVAPQDYTANDDVVNVVTEDADAGPVARFELGTADSYSSGFYPPGDVQRDQLSAPTSGRINFATSQTLWHAFSIKFDADYDHGTLVNPAGGNPVSDAYVAANPGDTTHQGHWIAFQTIGPAESTVCWGVSAKTPLTPPGSISCWVDKWTGDSTSGSYVSTFVQRDTLLHTSRNVGNWIDIKMQIRHSKSTDGFVKIWVNGAAQTLLGGGTQFDGRTCVPNTNVTTSYDWVYPALGIYRGYNEPAQAVSIANYRIADSEASL